MMVRFRRAQTLSMELVWTSLPHELFGLALHGLVLVGQVFQAGISAVLVGVDRAAVLNADENPSLHHVRILRWHGHPNQLALAPAECQRRSLAHRYASHSQLLELMPVGFLASEVLLIGLHHTRQERILVATGLLGAMEYVPGCLLGPVQRFRELQR